jgi:isoleucyl-tRNA synthetase
MAFEKVDPKADFPAMEREILAFWQEDGTFDKLRAKNAGGRKWSFLDGPITANNPMGVHHAWGRTYKDVFQRYNAMKGCEQRYQNGFDCQGLWVEVEVEKEHKFESKKDIEKFGIGKFVNECKARAEKFSHIQAEQSKRLGYWMDWDNSYYTMSSENNYAIWAFLKKCNEQGYIYKGSDVMPWCARCGTGISQMEMNEGYHQTEHLSVFVRFKIRERENEYLLVWTTTPWTLTSNVAAAVKPDMDYVRVQQGDDFYYIGKANFNNSRSQPVDAKADKGELPSLMSIQAIFKNLGGFEIVKELKGEKLVNLTYDGPFDHLDGASEAKDIHRVIAWDMVTELEGSGIVHIAPGCGAEDCALGRELGLPAIAPLEENGRFKAEFGPLAGKLFSEVATEVAEDLKQRSVLVTRERYVHRYPHCWRCKNELVYRLVDEWFINMDWRERIMESTRNARWIPSWGLERELDWLRNMGDWMISKKRYWGLALPIWECQECGHFEVIGSREELKERAVAGWDEFEGNSPHRPWVDAVKIKCERCNCGEVSRVKDVGNPWLDASIVPFSTMGYFSDRDYWKEWFPADFIVESLPGQFRNWFYALLAVGTMMVDRAPFKNILGHGLVLDDNYEEMHKSKGNAIPFDEAADRFGVDVLRWMYTNHSPERNLAFGPKHTDEIRQRMLIPLWNVYAFFSNYARLDEFDPSATRIPARERSDLDRWILSDLQLLIHTADKGYSEFDVESFCKAAERFVDNLSGWYVRRSRRRFWKSEQTPDKAAAYQTLYEVLVTLSELLAPIMPFVTEVMYRNLVAENVAGATHSIHLRDFPRSDDALIDETLSKRMAAFLRVTSMARSVRTASKLKVRQPLAEIIVVPADDTERAAVEQFSDHLLEELNVKNVSVRDDVNDMREVRVRGNMQLLGPKHGKAAGGIAGAIGKLDPESVARAVEMKESTTVTVGGEDIVLEVDEILVDISYGDDWAAQADGHTTVLLDKRMTDDLKREGIARDVVRFVQNLRKESNLNIEDRIKLWLITEGAAENAAISQFRDYIAGETLATNINEGDSPADGASAKVKIDGAELAIVLAADK